jgi:hypothetical protein
MKYDKIIAGPLLVNCYLPTSCWCQVDLHTPDLRLTAYPLYAFSTWESMKISYLRKIELRCICTNLTTERIKMPKRGGELGFSKI